MDSTFGTDVLGLNYLPPSPLYPVGQLPSAAAAPASASPASALDLSQALGSTAPSPASLGPGGLDLGPLMRSAFAPQGGVLGPNTGQFMSALGAGLSSAGQNWNKPAMAAFAGGAGAAIQGGQQFQSQQQDAKLKALQAVLAAWKVGDMASYHQALANYHVAVAQQRAAAMAGARPVTRVAPPAAAGQTPAPGQGAGGGSFAAPALVYGNEPAAGAGAPAPRTLAPSDDPLAQARDAIARGAPRDAVIERLRDDGIDPAGL